MARLLYVPAAAIVLASCAAPSYRSEVPFTNQTFQSTDSILLGRVPQGWFVSTDPELAPHLAAWLVREDYIATLTFQEMKVDENAAQHIESEGLVPLAHTSFSLKQAEKPEARITAPPTEFSLDGKKFCRYEYTLENPGTTAAVVVFRARNRYFESAAHITKADVSPQELRQLLNVQQAVLASLQP